MVTERRRLMGRTATVAADVEHSSGSTDEDDQAPALGTSMPVSIPGVCGSIRASRSRTYICLVWVDDAGGRCAAASQCCAAA